MKLPAGRQCVTRGCGRARYRGEWCDACYRRALKTQREPAKVIHATVYPTGQVRRGEARPEQEMTDGRQRWWVSG